MKYILLPLILLTFISCSTNNDTEQKDFRTENNQEIIDYIAANNLNAQESASGLYYVINEPGTGVQPTTTSNVTVAYKGYFTDGNVFDESSATGISFSLQ